jgi:hypothetical protein
MSADGAEVAKFRQLGVTSKVVHRKGSETEKSLYKPEFGGAALNLRANRNGRHLGIL